MSSNDPVRVNAAARLEAARAEAARWTEFLRTYDELAELAASTERLGDRATGLAAASETARPLGRLSRAAMLNDVLRAGARVAETERMAQSIITEIGHPVSTKMMLEEMTKRGFQIPGQDPVATLHTRLSRAPSLENRRPFGWRLRQPRREERAEGSPASQAEPPALNATPNEAERREEVVDDNTLD